MANVDLSSGFTLSSDLADQYRRLSAPHQQLFLKLFRQIFNFLLPATRITSHGGVLLTYYLVNKNRRKLGLTVSDLDLLTLIYHLSGGGRETIRSDKLISIYPTISSRTFGSLKNRGLISRHTFDPCRPFLSSQRSHRPVFVRLTPSGIGLIKDFDSRLRASIYGTLLSSILS